MRGIDDQLAPVARAFAYRANAGRAVEFEMNHAPFARGHGIEAERLVGFADALRGHAGRELEFFEARGAIIAAIEADAVVRARIKAQPAVGDMLESEKKLGVALKEQRLVVTAESDDDFRFFGAGGDGDIVF